MKKIIKLLTVTLALVTSSCKKADLDSYLDNPNEVGINNADPNLLLNTIETDFGDFFSYATRPGMELTRMTAIIRGATYEQAYIAENEDLNETWNIGYRKVISNIETLIPLATASELYVHTGIAKIIKGYILLTLVDYFGKVPYSEALKANQQIFNPKADDDKAVYEAALKVIDEGIEDLGKKAAAQPSRDIFYNGNVKYWIAAANTIKLKAYINTSLSNVAESKSAIVALLEKDLIDTPEENFTFKYGTSLTPTISRSRYYRQFYQPSAGSADGYIGNSFMFRLYAGKGMEDPRWRYYFFRQVGSIKQALKDDPDAIPCIASPRPNHYIERNEVFCAFDPGFYGRDHGNNDGIPPDSRAMTAMGAYPAGGRLDINNGDKDYQSVTQAGQGANGAGIEPILMRSFTSFMKAEAMSRLGISGNAKTMLQKAIEESVSDVVAFATSKGLTLPSSIKVTNTSDYVAHVIKSYESSKNKMEVIGEEYYIALFGNGIESYNLYRRTGMPNLQPMRAQNSGEFYRSMIYPAKFVNLNSSTPQKTSNKIKVFWDTNPDGFIN